MSRKQRYIELSESEQATLREGSKYHSKHEFRERCQALLLSKKGWSIQQLAEHFEVVYKIRLKETSVCVGEK
jgi:hypothetical protein